ncbi:MAG: YicC family protein [Puniceicoccaceae bacterium]|mgnify:CR=1 FL=1|nr:MAG: YicC family protein [Puniceicoccaceae bacterium]
MISMTGYGSSSFEIPNSNNFLEFTIQSVNRKNLDFQIYVPSEWSELEQRINEWTKGRVQRGRILIHLKINKRKANSHGFILNELALDQSIQEMQSFCQARSIPFQIDGIALIKLNQLLKEQEALPEWQTVESTILDAFEVAFEQWQSMRRKEGQALENDLCERIDRLSDSIFSVGKHASKSSQSYAEKLLDRLRSMDLELDLDDERLLKELAIFADRSDISEEITRLHSHLEQFDDCIQAENSVGRKMDFLCIEVFRELNTISSKSQDVSITKTILECKNELERIREQVQNIE